MRTNVTRTILEKNLKTAKVRFAKLALPGGCDLLVTEHWGKAFGPFRNDQDSGALWVSEKAADPGALKAMVDNGDWCVGGDRLWLAPEVQFNIPDRSRWKDEGGYVLPKEIDPGRYTLSSTKTCVTVGQELTVGLANLAAGKKRLALQRSFRAAADPLAGFTRYRKMSEKVHFTGYSEETTVRDLSGGGAGLETWNLIQVRPGGIAIIPTTGAIDYQDYYAPIDGKHLKVKGSVVVLRLTGDRTFKIGLKSAGSWGRIGYCRETGGGTARLIVRNFFNSPSSAYIDEPIGKAGSSGDSVQVYNDDGRLGGFGEIEVHGLSVGGETGRKASTDPLDLWLYTGTPSEIRAVARMLLGTDIVTW